jgi:hypothetical protein
MIFIFAVTGEVVKKFYFARGLKSAGSADCLGPSGKF